MRDLQKDLSLCQSAAQGLPEPMHPLTKHFVTSAIEGWPEAIRRAMVAEAKVRTAKEALKKLEYLLLLPEFSELDGRIWRIIDNALAALEGGEQNA